MKHQLALAASLLVVSLAAPVAIAQSADAWTAIQQLQADARADRQALVAANMPLTEAEAQVFWPVYKAYRTEADAIGDRHAKAIVEYASKYESMDDVTAESLAKQMFKIEHDRVALREKYFKNLRKVVSPAKAARAVQIESRLDTIISLAVSSEVPLVPVTKK